MFKFLIAVIVLAVIGAGLYFTGWYTKITDMIPMMHQTEKTTDNVVPVATTTQEQPPAQPAPVNDLPTAANDASDGALAQDSAAMDTQMQGLSTDSANASASLSDKPVTQEY